MKVPGRVAALGPGVDGLGALVIDGGVGGHVFGETTLFGTRLLGTSLLGETACEALCTPGNDAYSAADCTSQCCGTTAGCGATGTGTGFKMGPWGWILGGVFVFGALGLVALVNWEPE